MELGNTMVLEKFRDSSKPKRRRTLHLGPCRICAKLSTGVHYGVVSCEGCKAFFKRATARSEELKCFAGGNCDITSVNQTCRPCRYQRCVETGMNPDCAIIGRMSRARKEQHMKENEMRELISKPNLKPMHLIQVKEEKDITDDADQQRKTFAIMDMVPSNVSSPAQENHPPIFSTFFPSNYNFHNFSEPYYNLSNPSLHISDHSSHLDFIGRPETPYSSKLGKYMFHLNGNEYSFEKTIEAIENSIQVAYADQLDTWDRFMYRALKYGEIPVQPEVAVELYLAAVAYDVHETTDRSAQFIKGLPGYYETNMRDLGKIMSERWQIPWLITHSNYFHEGDLYCLAGPNRYHCCRYWIDRVINGDYVRFTMSMLEEIKSMGLSLVELYTLLAAIIFWPGSTKELANPVLLNLLHAHYIDVLIQLVRLRCPKSNINDFLSKIRLLIFRLDNASLLDTHYRNTPATQPDPAYPFQPDTGAAILHAICSVEDETFSPSIF